MNPNKKVFITVLSFVLAIVVIACSCSSLIPTGTPPQPTTGGGGNTQPTAGGGGNPQPTLGGGGNPQPTLGGGGTGQQILFQDDFSNPNSGWDHSSNQDGTADYANGGYEIHVISTSYILWTIPSQALPNDVSIQVDATKIGGPDDNAFGVICRYQDADNYLYFYISSDGYVGIGLNSAGTRIIISDASGKMITDSSSSINQGAATNHLRADCIGNTMTLFVNGTQVATATDSDFTAGGDVGMIARTFSVGGADILFSNFFVYKP